MWILLSDRSYQAVFHARRRTEEWASENISTAIHALRRADTTLHRGPLTIAARRTIC